MVEGGRTQAEVTRCHLAHIIKDVVDPPNGVVYYGMDGLIIPTFKSPEFGMETWGLNSSGLNDSSVGWYDWNMFDPPYYGYEFANLFLSIDYAPTVRVSTATTAANIHFLMKPAGVVILVNPGDWAKDVGIYLSRDEAIEDELKRYSLFAKEDVRAYRK